jgi:hypothetical protein
MKYSHGQAAKIELAAINLDSIGYIKKSPIVAYRTIQRG